MKIDPADLWRQMCAATKRAAKMPLWLRRHDPPLDICPTCGGPTEHVCSWACVDFCDRCDGYR